MMGAMDHRDVRELLEDAAIEPDGLERLMAGDTPTRSRSWPGTSPAARTAPRSWPGCIVPPA